MANFNLNEFQALRTASSILTMDPVGITWGGAKDVLNGQTPPPRNIGEAIQMFTEGLLGKARDPFYYRSQYGNPIYNYLLIKGDSATQAQSRSQLSTLSSYRVGYQNTADNPKPNQWTELEKDLTLSTQSFPAIFMDSALMVVDKKKDIVKTKVVGRNSTRKEYITSGDYSVKISGVFTTNKASVYPVSDMDALIRACEAPIPLEVISPYLFRFGITKLVVDSFSFPQERGSYASQKFSISCTSHNSSYAELDASILNENQKKGLFDGGVQELSNLRSKVDSQVEEFLTSNPFTP